MRNLLRDFHAEPPATIRKGTGRAVGQLAASQELHLKHQGGIAHGLLGLSRGRVGGKITGLCAVQRVVADSQLPPHALIRMDQHALVLLKVPDHAPHIQLLGLRAVADGLVGDKGAAAQTCPSFAASRPAQAHSTWRRGSFASQHLTPSSHFALVVRGKCNSRTSRTCQNLVQGNVGPAVHHLAGGRILQDNARQRSLVHNNVGPRACLTHEVLRRPGEAR